MSTLFVLAANPDRVNRGMTLVEETCRQTADWLAAQGVAVEIAELVGPDEAGTSIPLLGCPEQMDDADHIVYWGDFVHMKRYIQTTSARLKRLGHSSERATQLAYDILLPESHERVTTVGTTLLLNGPSDYADQAYADRLVAFLNNSSGWFRDPFSLSTAKLLAPVSNVHLGLDCAFLTERWATTPSREMRIGVFMGRGSRPYEAVALTIRAVARRLEMTPHWIEWGHTGHFRPLNTNSRFSRLSGLQGSESRTVDLAPDRLLRGFSAVLTDTYHLAVYCIAIGLPVIMVLPPSGNTTAWNVSQGPPEAPRDKRWVLMNALDLGDMVIDLRAPLIGAVRRAIDRSVSAACEWDESRSQQVGRLSAAILGEVRSHIAGTGY